MNWISVKDQMPPNLEVVLLHSASEGCFVGYFDNSSSGFAYMSLTADKYDKITHWMYLPALPGEADGSC